MDDGEVSRALFVAEAARDFLLDLHHAAVAFGLIVGERHGGIMKEAQRILFAQLEAQEEIMSSVHGATAGALPVPIPPLLPLRPHLEKFEIQATADGGGSTIFDMPKPCTAVSQPMTKMTNVVSESSRLPARRLRGFESAFTC